MKKLLLLMLVILLTFSCVSCGSNKTKYGAVLEGILIGGLGGSLGSLGGGLESETPPLDEYDVNDAYNDALSLGFRGSLLDFIAAISGYNSSFGRDGVKITYVNLSVYGEILVAFSDNTTVSLGSPQLYCDHIYSEWDVLYEPTCESVGMKTRVCENCNITEYRTIEATEHIYRFLYVIVSNCSERTECHMCNVCNTTRSVSVAPTVGCVDYDGNLICDNCGRFLGEEESCHHRDADDDFLCDYCFEYFNDGVDSEEPEIPDCEHRDADDDCLCDYCLEEFDDGEEPEIGPSSEGFEGGYLESYRELEYNSLDGTILGGATELDFGNVGAIYNGYTNVAGATVLVCEEWGGNRYLRILAPKRQNTNDRAHHVIAYPEEYVPLELTNSYVLEFDILLDSTALVSDYVVLALRNTLGRIAYINYTASGNDVFFSDVKIATVSSIPSWTNVRLEYYPEGGHILVYSDGAYAGCIVSASLSNLSKANLREVRFIASNTACDVDFGLDNVSFYTSDNWSAIP